MGHNMTLCCAQHVRWYVETQEAAKKKSAAARQEVQQFIQAHQHSGTTSANDRYQKEYIQWCLQNGIDYNIPQPEQVARYLSQMWNARRWGSGSTFNSVRSAISNMYKYTYPEIQVGDHPLVTKTMETIGKLAEPSKSRKPITTEHFSAIFHKIDMTSFRDVRDYAMMLFMFAMARRECEAIEFTKENVTIDTARECLIVTFEPAKQRKRTVKETAIAFAPDNIVMDVDRWHRHYSSMMVASATYYFHSVEGKQLSASTPYHSFQRLFALAGLDFTGFGSHSARVGGTTAMIAAGSTEPQIKNHGTWSGEVYKRYNQPPVEVTRRNTEYLNQQRPEKRGKQSSESHSASSSGGGFGGDGGL
jgi:site-specific recombinase XerD